MKYKQENIKEISLVTHFIFYGYDPNYYDDLLRVSKNWISYSRTNFHSGKEVASWSHKTNCERYEFEFKTLASEACKIIEEDSFRGLEITDSGSFNLRITFKDNTHIDLHGSSNLYRNNLENIAQQLKILVPSGEVYPDFLNKYYFYRYILTEEKLKKIDKQRLVVFMYAEGGAMGRPGEYNIIDDNGTVYTNWTKRDSDDESEYAVSQIEASLLFDGFEHKSMFPRVDSMWTFINNEQWFYLSLGAGNHLYMRNDFYDEYINELFDSNEARRYVNWCKLIKVWG